MLHEGVRIVETGLSSPHPVEAFCSSLGRRLDPNVGHDIPGGEERRRGRDGAQQADLEDWAALLWGGKHITPRTGMIASQ